MELEAAPGFEPGNKRFAGARLTTWLCRPTDGTSCCGADTLAAPPGLRQTHDGSRSGIKTPRLPFVTERCVSRRRSYAASALLTISSIASRSNGFRRVAYA